MDASVKAWRLCYRLMDRNAIRQDHTEASLKDMEQPWLSLSKKLFACILMQRCSLQLQRQEEMI